MWISRRTPLDAQCSIDIQIDQRANQKFSTKEQVKWNGLSAEKRMKWLSRRNREEAKYWLKKVVHGECEHKVMGKADMIDAQEKLKEKIVFFLHQAHRED